jgi:hypothetical protein
VCQNPKGNAACLVLKEIRDSRDDDRQQALAGQSIQALDQTTQWPACIGERATFMAPFDFTRVVKHPYAGFSKEHEHITPAAFRHPEYSAATIPFRWMMRKSAWELAEQLDLDVDPNREPMDGWLERNNWVQDHGNQRALLEAFFGAVVPTSSLCFFYVKQSPMIDDSDRVLVGAGRVLSLGPLVEYGYSTSKTIRSYVWDRAIQHSIRPEFGDGFLLPYHELLDRARDDESIDLGACTALAPEDRRMEFSYAGEHVTHDGAIAAMLSCRAALERSAEYVSTPIGGMLKWIDDRLGELWKLRGPTPGLGAALTAFGVDHGNFVAYDLAAKLGENESPWPLVDAVMEDPTLLPPAIASRLTRTTRDKWAAIKEKKPERRALLELIARFELTDEQATRAYVTEERDKAGVRCTDADLLSNPYLLFEADRQSVEPMTIWTVDRGVFPAPIVREKHPLPNASLVTDSTDGRRVRALAVSALEDAARHGHTIQPRSALVKAIRELPIDPHCGVDGDLLDVVEHAFSPTITVGTMADATAAYQLEKLDRVGGLIRRFVEKRAKGVRHGLMADWRMLIDAELGSDGAGDELEERARTEKARALKELGEARVSVLVGPAGTGKTTLLKVFIGEPAIASGGVLLLAPTGKARVRMETATGHEAKTLAQFLLPLDRYDERTGAYLVTGENAIQAAKTVIVDESSMLTEEQLASLIDSLKGLDRLILVGDPRQLPPIGAGRPFFDIVDRLAPENVEALVPRVSAGYAELTVHRRHIGEQREDIQLADWFSGQAVGPGEDEILSRSLASEEMKPLRFVRWDTSDELREIMLSTLVEELGLTGAEDVLGFEKWLGGSEYEGRTYFRRGAATAAESWQILSPVRGLTHGVRDLNRLIQTTFRSGTIEFARSDRRRIPEPMGAEGIVYGDKVINLMNRRRKHMYPKDDRSLYYVANGEIGVVVGQFKSSKAPWKGYPWKLEVEFTSQQGYNYDFTRGDLADEASPLLELAYAVTVHKSQGSEFGLTFLVLPNSGRLLSRELLYTALTRQKDRIVVLHQGDRAELWKYASDYYSETKRRLTNLFIAPQLAQVADRYLEHRLIHRSSRGEPMRSKSEVIIADQLAAAGIDYEYEAKLVGRDGKTRIPDFTVIDDDSGRSYYWEHCGMLMDPDYAKRWAKKLDWYREEKILPVEEGMGDRGTLIVTADDLKGGISSHEIKELIASLF